MKAATTDLAGLIAEFREAAEVFRSHAQEGVARTYERCAGRLEETVGAIEDAPLTLQEAAKLGGYSSEHLGRLVREGKVPNAGRKGAPRIARKDVPIKAGKVAQEPETCEIEFKQIVRSAINEGAA